MAFPALHGKILNLRDLEQGIEDMNRLSHWGARMRIIPGAKAGTSTVVISAPKHGVLHGQVWFDNYGQKITGQETGHAMLTAENPLGLLDLWSVEYDHSLVGQAGQRGTSYLSVNGSIPFGYWTVFGSWWHSEDEYPLRGLSDLYHLSGGRRDWRLGISRVLLRNSLGITSFQVSYERKSFGSEINHTVIDTETARQSFVNLQVSESLKGWGGVWYITGGLKVAVAGAGTWSNIAHPGLQEPHSSYLKPSLDIDGYKPLCPTCYGIHRYMLNTAPETSFRPTSYRWAGLIQFGVFWNRSCWVTMAAICAMIFHGSSIVGPEMWEVRCSLSPCHRRHAALCCSGRRCRAGGVYFFIHASGT